MAKVTSFDVARLAGVSQPTVSRALRNLPGTSPSTRKKVLRAAAELSYIASDSARILSTNRTRRVAVVSEELTNPYYPELVEPLRKHLAAQGLRAVVVIDTESAEVTLDVLADGSYDGVVLTTTTRHSHLPRDLTERGIPHVLANRVLDHPESPSCAVDNASGMDTVAELLADLGHTRVAAVHGPLHTSTGRERAEALHDSLRARGISLRRPLTVRSAFSHDAGLEAALPLLALDERPTAVVCGNDVIAMGVLSAARTLGLEVPRDLTVIGFDDIPMAAWPLVSLTTVQCDLDLLAAEVAGMLVAEIEQPTREPKERRTPTTLQLRSTHGVPRERSSSSRTLMR